MPKFENLTGQKFGMLTVIKLHEKFIRSNSGRAVYRWECKCDCGNTTIVNSTNLKTGHVKSCKCVRRQKSTERIIEQSKKNIKHGLARTRLYYCWHAMIDRCFNIEHKGYKNYGGRGITVCDEWRNDFRAFYDWAISNGYSNELTIDRINVDGNYEPLNCRWATKEEQGNNRRTNVFIEFNGEKLTIAEMAKKYNLPDWVLRQRINKGWDIEKAILTPVKS